jgi:hypothetical protein
MSFALIILAISSIIMLLTGGLLRFGWKTFKENSSEDKTIQIYFAYLTGNTVTIIGFFLASVFITLLFTWIIIREIIGIVFGVWI